MREALQAEDEGLARDNKKLNLRFGGYVHVHFGKENYTADKVFRDSIM